MRFHYTGLFLYALEFRMLRQVKALDHLAGNNT